MRNAQTTYTIRHSKAQIFNVNLATIHFKRERNSLQSGTKRSVTFCSTKVVIPFPDKIISAGNGNEVHRCLFYNSILLCPADGGENHPSRPAKIETMSRAAETEYP